ncbi:MAG: transposase family protein [Terriglobia bacterium]
MRRKRGHGEIECSGCGPKFRKFHDLWERAVRDLPWGEFQTTVYIEIYRVKRSECGVKREKVLQLPSEAPFSKRFEEARMRERFGTAGGMPFQPAGERVETSGHRPCSALESSDGHR